MSTLDNTEKPDVRERAKSIADSAIQNLVAALESGESEALKRYLATMSRFHDYSFGNVMLIASQRPTATHVAGFNAWRQFNRFVRKGEKGIAILAPLVRRKREDDDPETPETQCFGFRIVYVFDIEQTDGEPLPEIAHASGDPADAAQRLIDFARSQHITIDYSADIAPAKGMSKGGAITLLPDQSRAEEFATLVHEIAHELLHRGDRRKQTTKTIRETEAEAVAFVVSSVIGLDMSTSSVDYIRLYNGDKETLSESLTHVQRAATLMIEALETVELREAVAA
jgi:hypothetical protein